MNEQKYLVTTDSEGRVLKVERLGADGDLTEVPITALTPAPAASHTTAQASGNGGGIPFNINIYVGQGAPRVSAGGPPTIIPGLRIQPGPSETSDVQAVPTPPTGPRQRLDSKKSKD